MCFVATTAVPSVLKNALKNGNETQQQYNHSNAGTLCVNLYSLFHLSTMELNYHIITQHNTTGQDKDGSLNNETNHMQKSKKFN